MNGGREMLPRNPQDLIAQYPQASGTGKVLGPGATENVGTGASCESPAWGRGGTPWGMRKPR